MKKLLSIFVMMLLCVVIHASEAYFVQAKILNMRSKPISGAKKLGSLNQGDAIRVDTIIGDWATCVNEAGEKYYVSAKYLKKKDDVKAEKQDELNKKYGVPPTWTLQQKIRKALTKIGIDVKPNPSKRPFTWALFLPMFAIAVIVVIYYITSWIFDESWADNIGLILTVFAAAAMSVLELWCIVVYDGDPAWFCDISSSVITIIFWLVMMGILVVAQAFILYLMNAEVAVSSSGVAGPLDLLGPISTYIFAGIYLVLYLFFSDLQPYVAGLFLLCQVLHLVLRFISLERKSVMGIIWFGIGAVCYVLIALATFLLIVMTVAHVFYMASNVSFWWYLVLLLIIPGILGGGGGYLGQVSINGKTYDVYQK